MNEGTSQIIQVPVYGMDCAACARTVQEAVSGVPGVRSVDVLLSAQKAVIEIDASVPGARDAIRRAIVATGYPVSEDVSSPASPTGGQDFALKALWLFGLVFGAVLVVLVAGEWLGLFASVTAHLPYPVGAGLVLLVGYPVFAQVAHATLQGRVIAHTLMAVGALAALLAGVWVTAGVVVFFMRVGAYAERFTTERARDSLRSLTRLAPRRARVVRDGAEQEVPMEDVRPGDVVIVRPGEQVPVDGTVLTGQATINQASITGEGLPVEAGTGSTVYAATIATLGTLRIEATAVGRDTTFGRVVRMVEEAEAHRGDVQRVADRFSAYYLPVVAAVAVLTYAFSRDVMATVSVLVVACSCAFALATPVAILASVGAAARRGILIKGGKYLEILDRADVMLLDKTGTLTLGQPKVTDVVCLNGLSEEALLTLAASAEEPSEHPLAEAVRVAAQERGILPTAPTAFVAVPGQGIRARVGSHEVVIGGERLAPAAAHAAGGLNLIQEGKTVLYVEVDGEPAGILAASDTARTEVPQALAAVRRHGIKRIELLTGDNERAAFALASRLGLSYRAGLLPEDKVAIVRQYQAAGHTVVMVGDGVNDAPALAQADVGIAMGAAGSDVAIEAAHIALMRDDWRLVPELLAITRRTLRVVKLNIAFTALYNLVGLSLAALGMLPPILAAAAQSLPDLGILANSARLLRQR